MFVHRNGHVRTILFQKRLDPALSVLNAYHQGQKRQGYELQGYSYPAFQRFYPERVQKVAEGLRDRE